MTITVGTDSYVTVAEFVTYGTAKGWDSLLNLSNAALEQLLKDAFTYLNNSFGWKGQITDLSQAGAWPRVNVVDKEGRTLDSATVPTVVENAQMEIAGLQHINGDILATRTDGTVKSVKAGSVAVTFADGSLPTEGEKIPHVARMLTGLYTTAPGQRVANVSLLKA